MDHYQRKFQQRLQKQLYNDSIEQVTKIVAPVANKAEESMQHLQEYNKHIDNGNTAAIEHYSKELCVGIKESLLLLEIEVL